MDLWVLSFGMDYVSTLFGEEESKVREMVEIWWEGPKRSRANQGRELGVLGTHTPYVRKKIRNLKISQKKLNFFGNQS
jgi:hypothetical protein